MVKEGTLDALYRSPDRLRYDLFVFAKHEFSWHASDTLIWGGDEVYDDDESGDPDTPAAIYDRGFRLICSGEDLQSYVVWCENGGRQGFDAFVRTVRHYQEHDAFLFPGEADK